MSRQRSNGQGTVYKRQPGGTWYIRWYDHEGKRRSRNTKTTDKRTADRILASILEGVAQRRSGLIDLKAEAAATQAMRPLEEHLADFEDKMKASNCSKDHIEKTLVCIRAVTASAKFKTAGDIDADGVNRFACNLSDKGRSARTIQAHLTAIKSFVKWLAAGGKLVNNPLTAVKAPSVKADRRKRRRPLLLDEWPWLRAATLSNGFHHGMDAEARAILYGVAVQTGLRSSELRSLTKAHLALKGKAPYIRCKAEDTKNGNQAQQHIQADLAEQLRRLVTMKAPTAPVFDMPDKSNVFRMLQKDLAKARATWLEAAKHAPEELQRRQASDFLQVANHQGESLDFHSLRHTCGFWLAQQGCQPKTIQTVMRHSSITLTMDTYGHVLPQQHADAIATMPAMFSSVPDVIAATGTTGGAVTVQGTTSTRNGAKPCGSLRDAEEERERDASCIPLRIADLDDQQQEDATCCEMKALGIEPRTYGLKVRCSTAELRLQGVGRRPGPMSY
jgi:integrase